MGHFPEQTVKWKFPWMCTPKWMVYNGKLGVPLLQEILKSQEYHSPMTMARAASLQLQVPAVRRAISKTASSVWRPIFAVFVFRKMVGEYTRVSKTPTGFGWFPYSHWYIARFFLCTMDCLIYISSVLRLLTCGDLLLRSWSLSQGHLPALYVAYHQSTG